MTLASNERWVYTKSRSRSIMENTIETYWVCACDTCGEREIVARPRTKCPFDEPPISALTGKAEPCNVYNYERQSCTVCDWSDDYAGYTTCPECEVSE
jgi:hypothetical protein